MRLRRNPLGRRGQFSGVSCFREGGADSVLGNRSMEKLYVWNLYSFLSSFPGTHVAFQTCEKHVTSHGDKSRFGWSHLVVYSGCSDASRWRLSRGPLRFRKRSGFHDIRLRRWGHLAVVPGRCPRQVLGVLTSCSDERPVIGFSSDRLCPSWCCAM